MSEMLTYIAMLTFFVSTVLESELLQRGAKQTHVFVSSCLSLCYSLCVYFKSELLLYELTHTCVVMSIFLVFLFLLVFVF